MLVGFFINIYNSLFKKNQKCEGDELFQPGELVFPDDISISTESLTYSTSFSTSA